MELVGRQPVNVDTTDLRPGTVVVMKDGYGVYLRPCGQFDKCLIFHPQTGITGIRGVERECVHAPEENEVFVVLNEMTETQLEKIMRTTLTKQYQ